MRPARPRALVTARRRRVVALAAAPFLVAILVVPRTGLLAAATEPARPLAAVASTGELLVKRFKPSALPLVAKAIGEVPSRLRLRLDVLLEPSNSAGMTALLRAVYDPSSKRYHRWLSTGQFDRRFGPTASELGAVRAWLGSIGLTAGTPHGLIVPVLAPASAVARAFSTRFEQYSLGSSGRAYRALSPVTVHGPVTRYLAGLVGLDDVPELSSNLVRVPARPQPILSAHLGGQPACAAASATALTADVAGAHYGIDALVSAGLDGRNQRIALFEAAAHIQGDVGAYSACLGLSNSVETVPIDGGGLVGDGTAEADVDIEEAATQAPGAQILSYEAQNTPTASLDTWAAMVDQNLATVLSTSWGMCEPDAYASGTASATVGMGQLFAQAALQGQTILAASGDSGSEGCSSPDGSTALEVDFPASSPEVTGVGGTTLAGSSPDSVWNDPAGAGGGGLSQTFPLPSFQQGVVVGQSTGREVPDLSADAGTPQAFYTCTDPTCAGSAWIPLAGTSIAAPLIAGMTSDIDGGCAQPIGQLAPDLYAYAAPSWSPGGVYGTALTDVTAGNNDWTSTYGGADYPAGPGYDLASGLGTPIATGLVCPDVTSVSPASGPPGSVVTIEGTNLSDAVVTVASVPVTGLVRTATSATFQMPAGTGSVVIAARTPIGTGSVTASFSYAAPVTTTTQPPRPISAQIFLSSSVGKVLGRRALIAVRCPLASCRGTVSLTHVVRSTKRIGAKTVVRSVTVLLGTASYALRPDPGSRLVPVVLRPAGAAELASARGRLSATETAVVAGGPTRRRAVLLVKVAANKA